MSECRWADLWGSADPLHASENADAVHVLRCSFDGAENVLRTVPFPAVAWPRPSH